MVLSSISLLSAMKRNFSDIRLFFSQRTLVLGFMLITSALFFLGKDFYCVFSSVNITNEKKYQDEENSEQQNKTNKDQDETYSSFLLAGNMIKGLEIDFSNSYFIHAEDEWQDGYSEILSPPPDCL